MCPVICIFNNGYRIISFLSIYCIFHFSTMLLFLNSYFRLFVLTFRFLSLCLFVCYYITLFLIIPRLIFIPLFSIIDLLSAFFIISSCSSLLFFFPYHSSSITLSIYLFLKIYSLFNFQFFVNFLAMNALFYCFLTLHLLFFKLSVNLSQSPSPPLFSIYHIPILIHSLSLFIYLTPK